MMLLNKVGARAALTGALLCAAAFLAPAQAAKVGPYFPSPSSYNLNGPLKDALLAIQTSWLNAGLDNLKKARAAEAAADKQQELDALIGETEKEIAVATDNTASRDVQVERKRRFLLNLNQWINDLNHQATEQMKIAIMKDGAEAMVAQNRTNQLSEQADSLEKAKSDPSIENWGK